MSFFGLERISGAQLLIFGATGFAAHIRFDQRSPSRVAADEIRRTINRYFTGSRTANVKTVESAFLPDARLQAVIENDYFHRSLPEYLEFVRGGEARSWDKAEIVSLDVSETAAIVRVEIHANAKHEYTDFLQLLKQNNEWRIANKIFHRF